MSGNPDVRETEERDLIIYIKKFPLWKITFIKTLTQLDIKFAIDKYSTD